MINIILPNFYFFSAINQDLMKMYKEHPEYFYSDKISFIGQEGNYPFMYWSSTFVNEGTVLCDDIDRHLKTNNFPIAFNCANPLLTDVDFFNIAQNVALKLGENGSNNIIISSPSLLAYLKNKYPQYNFIGSEYYLASDPNLDYINDLLRIKVFFKHSEQLEKIPINKTEIVLNDPCENCAAKVHCLLKQWENNYNFSNDNCLTHCSKKARFLTTWEDLIALNKKGYQFFSFNFDSVSLNNLDLIKAIYIYFFIKDEYKTNANLYLRR